MGVNNRRVSSRQIQVAGSLDKLITELIDHVRVGNMETKERGAMYLRSLTEQPKGLDGPQTEDNAVLIARAGGLKPLIALVIIGSPVAQAHACAALANLARNRAEYQEAILEAGGVLPISSALRAGDAQLQEMAAAATSSISQLQAARKSIIKVGAIPSLVALLKSASFDTQIHASYALANLSVGNRDSQGAIARAGAFPLLIAQLGSGNTQEAVAHCLAYLVQDHDANQAEVVRLGGVSKLIALLSVVNAGAQAQAAAASAALASGDACADIRGEPVQIKTIIAKAGGIRPLLALIDTRYTHTQRSAINAVAMLAMKHKENQDNIALLGGIMPLVMIMQSRTSYTPDVLAQAVFALTEVARNNINNQSDIVKAGAVRSLVELLRHSNAPIVEAECAGAFWTLSEHHDDNKIAVASEGAIVALMSQLKSTTDRTSVETVERAHSNADHAIASLCLNNEVNQSEATALLVGLLEDAVVGTQARAADLLWRMVRENQDQHMVLAKAGDPEALVRLLTGTLSRAKAYALWSLSHAIDASNQKVVAESGGIRPLVSMLNDPNRRVNEQAACALKLLAQDNRDTQMAIANQGAVEPLIALLDSDGFDRTQEHAAATLSDLAHISGNKAAIDRGGGIQPLVVLLSDTHRQLPAKKYAAAALARLSADENDLQDRDEMRDKKVKQLGAASPPSKRRVTKAELIADAGAIGPLVELLNGVLGDEAQEEAAGALWALADHQGNRKAITEHGGIGPLVELLGSPNRMARSHAEGALVRLSIENVNRVLIIKQLVEMLQETSGTAAQEQAAAALANLARESTENRTSILEAGGIPKLLSLLYSTSQKAIMNAVSAIGQLSYNNLANQNAITEANGLQALVDTLSPASNNQKESTNAQMCTLCATAIWYLAEGNYTNQTKLMKAGAIPPVVALLANASPEMQTNAAGALAALSRGHADNQGGIARCGAIAPLCNMVREGAPETREESAGKLLTYP